LRVNIYSQELICEPNDTDATIAVELVAQKVEELDLTYSGVRLYLHSSERLHAVPGDDDRSAITFWLPKTPERREMFARSLEELASLVREASPENGLD
jgi:hypothetical protein